MDSFAEERQKLDFDQEELSSIIYGGKEGYEEHKKLSNVFASDPLLKLDSSFYDLPREKQIGHNLMRARRLHDLAKTTDFPEVDFMNIGKLADYSGSVSPLGLHYGMFEVCIRYFANEEQQKEFMPKILNCEIQGCYAQTEIGHGSDVSSLETTATYDKSTETFIVNSPTLTSGKFWPGELGKTSTHACFHAQLIIDGKNYGVQTFLCQIRDLDSHRPLKGLDIGDIGPKGGYQQKDNGYMYFKNFVIPRTALLSKYTRVSKEGNFSINGNPKFAYASMMFIRLYLIGVASVYPAKALLIAIRYSLARKQFKTLNDGRDERKILDYQAQQAALTPILSFVFAALFTKFRMKDLFLEMMDKIVKKNDFKLLKESHSLGSCLKAHFTDRSLEYLKIIRECCGGHGFLQYSGIANMIDIAAPNVTLEGDNVVMFQQTAKHIIKSCGKIVQGKKLNGSLSYLNDFMSFMDTKLKHFDPNDSKQLLNILKSHVLYHIGRVAKYLQVDQKSFDEKWNKIYQADIVKVAHAHAVYMTATSFVEGIQSTKISKELHKHFDTLCKIHLAHSIVNYADGAILSGYAKAKHLVQTEELMYEHMEAIRPQLLNIVEALSIPDEGLNSVIGSSQGDLYEKIFAASSNNPLNTKDKLDAMDTHVKPISQRLAARMQ